MTGEEKDMKKFVAMIMAILMLSALIGPSAYAEVAVKTEGTYDSTTGTLTITAYGTMEDFEAGALPPWESQLENVETIKKVIIPEGVTHIGAYTFTRPIDTLVVPSTLKSVSTDAFNYLGDGKFIGTLEVLCTMSMDPENTLRNWVLKSVQTVHDSSVKKDSLVEVKKVDATYDKEGMEAHYKCPNSNCSALFKTDKTTPTTNVKIDKLEDNNAPVITKAPAVSPSGVNKGGSATIIVYAEDPNEKVTQKGSGLASGSVTFANTADPTKTVPAGLNLDEGYLTGTLFFQKDATPGEYKLSELKIKDKKDNEKVYTAAEVESAVGSSVPTVSVSEHTMTHHDRVEPTYYKAGTIEYWQCEDCGKRFSDALGNTEVTDIIIPMLNDTTPPVFDNIIVELTSITPSQNVGVTVTAHDEGVGLQKGEITFKNLLKSDSSPVTAELKLDGASKTILKGTLTFPPTAASGDYYVDSLYLEDELRHGITLRNSDLQKYKDVKITVNRWAKVGTVGTLSLNATSLGYGGTATGTIILKDANGNVLANKTLDIYEGTVKYTTVKTDDTGTATFQYTNKIPGTYAVKAMFNGDEDYNQSTTNIVNVTFTSVPATGDGYDVLLWTCVGALAIGVNVWFFLKRKKA